MSLFAAAFLVDWTTLASHIARSEALRVNEGKGAQITRTRKAAEIVERVTEQESEVSRAFLARKTDS